MYGFCGIFKLPHLRKIQTTKRVILCMSLPYFSVVYHTIMLNFIDNVLCQFESRFSHKAFFRWFVAITIGFILRSDKMYSRNLYGKEETIRYYSVDLLWGQKLYQELRFVLVEINGIQSILAGTSLELEPLSIIRLYRYRFWIERMFQELKQQTGAFCYHFWSKHMPKLSYYQKAGEPGPLERVESERSRRNIRKAVRAT